MAPPTCLSVTSEEITVVRRIAWAALRRAGLRHQDHADFVQHAFAEWCRRYPHFDEARSSHFAFVVGIARHAVADLVAHMSAASRDWRKCRNSLDAAEGEDNDSPPRAESLCDDVHGRRLGTPRLTPQDRRDFRCDLAGALPRFTPEDRKVCVLLTRYTKAEAARRLGISTATLHDRVLRIRDEFRRLHLDDYLSPSHRRPRG